MSVAGFRGEPYLKLCTEVCAYWRGPLEIRREAIAAFARVAREVLENRVRWYETETMGRRQPITAEAWDLLEFWLADRRALRQVMTLELEGGDDRELPSDAAFTFKSLDLPTGLVGACRLVVPVHVGQFESERLLELVRESFAVCGFLYGTAGFAIHWNPRSAAARKAKEHIPYIAARYWGIDVPQLTATLIGLKDGIKTINWVTMLSAELWENVAEVAEPLLENSPGVQRHSVTGGVLLQAGAQPRLGDRYLHESLEAYVQIGSAIRKLRSHSHPAIIPAEDEELSARRTDEWLSRFDGEP